MELTLPLTFGFHVVIAYGEVALKALLRAYTTPLYLISVKEPTAYMVPPHCTSCRTCSQLMPFGYSCGVAAGLADTEADAGAANPVTHTAAAAAATPARRHSCL